MPSHRGGVQVWAMSAISEQWLAGKWGKGQTVTESPPQGTAPEVPNKKIIKKINI